MAIPSSSFLIQAALAAVLAEWVRRAWRLSAFRRAYAPLEPADPPPAAPKVTLIVPMRDEENNAGNCLKHLFDQSYPALEIVVVDDRSSDRTPVILDKMCALSPFPMRVVRIEKLPPGWTGKNHAMAAGAKAASGEWFLFTDADTTHSPRSVATAVRTALERKIDFLTLAPRTEARGFWENVVQPIAVGALAIWFDPARVNDPASGITLANGQFILTRRGAYESVGGNEAVRSETVEDVALAKLTRRSGRVVAFLDGTRLYSTRMYGSLAEIHRGWTRIYTHLFEKKIPVLLEKTAFFLFFSIFPFAVLGWEKLLFLEASTRFDAAVAAFAAAACAIIVAVRFAGNRMLRANPWYALLHPLGSLILVWVLLTCVWRVAADRPSPWRGDLHK